jgi:hypothetical protein
MVDNGNHYHPHSCKIDNLVKSLITKDMSSPTIKYKLIAEIYQIEDEALLREVYILLHEMGTSNRTLILNEEQVGLIEEARADYVQGRIHTTEDVFK